MAKRISNDVRKVFADVLNDPEWASAVVPEIHLEGRRRLKEAGLDDSELPLEPWTYKFAADFRSDLSERDQWLAEQFSMASLNDSEFPSDPASVEFLGYFYRRSMAGGSILSNRRAIWAARLSRFFPSTVDHFWRLYWAWYWVKRYADLEFSRSLVGDPSSLTRSLDQELLFAEWPSNVSGDQSGSKVAKMLVSKVAAGLNVQRESSKFRRKLRDELEKSEQLHMMPEVWDDIIAEQYLYIVDLLSGVYENKPWVEQLSASDYDTVFLALRTIADRVVDSPQVMSLAEQVDLTDQLAMAVLSDDSNLVRRLVDESGTLREV
jgi:hypothetical protein